MREGKLAGCGLYSIETGEGKQSAERVKAERAARADQRTPPGAGEERRPNLLDPWEEFIAPDFPLDTLPETLAAFVRMQAKSTGGDVSAVSMAALTACSGAIDQQNQLKMKKSGDWHVRSRLWTGLIGDPSSKKTPIINAVTSPLRRLEFHARKAYEFELKRWQTLKDDGAEAGERPDPPTRYTIGDTTTEKVADVLSRQPRGLLVVADELSAFIGNMDRYRGGK